MPTWLLWQMMPWRTQNLRSLRSLTCEDCCWKRTLMDILSPWQYDKSPPPLRNHRCSNGSGPTLRYFYPYSCPIVAPDCGSSWSALSTLGSVGELVIILWPLKAGEWKRTLTYRLSSSQMVLFMWHLIFGFILWWNTIHGACWDCETNACVWGGESVNSHLIQPEP